MRGVRVFYPFRIYDREFLTIFWLLYSKIFVGLFVGYKLM